MWLVNGEKSHMAVLWDSNNFPQGEERYDIQLGATAQLGKEFVFLCLFLLGQYPYTGSLEPCFAPSRLVDSGRVLA